MNFSKVKLSSVYAELKVVFARSMGAYVGYMVLVWILSFLVSYLCSELSPSLGGLLSTFITTFFYLGYTSYASEDKRVKTKISFNHFFDSFKKPIGVVLFTLLQYFYVIVIAVILLLTVSGLDFGTLINRDLSGIFRAYSEHVVVLFCLAIVFVVIPYMITFLVPHRLVSSDDGLAECFSVSFEVFKKNWLNYLLVVVVSFVVGVVLAVVITMIGKISSVLSVIVVIPIGLFFLFIAVPMFSLLPFTFLGLTIDSELKEDIIE